MEEALELIGVGNALVDVIAFTDEDVAGLLGLSPNKAVHVDPRRFSELLVALPDPALSAGGGAASTMKIASRLGIRSAFVGRVGSKANGEPDRFARLFEKEMADAGVRLLLSRGAEPTGGCLVLRMADGSFSIAACPSAALGLEADELPEELVRQAKALLIDGYALGRTETVERALELADRYGTAVALDVGSEKIAAGFAPFIGKLLEGTLPLILFLNEAEALAFAAAANGGADIGREDAFAHLRARTEAGPYPIVVVKRGALGSVVFAGGSRFDAPSAAVAPRDETGAGDTFAAGFLAAWIRGKPLSECAAFGNRVAREAIAVPGTSIAAKALRKLAESLA